MMHPDFDCPENHLAREPFPEPDTTCTDCHGTRVLDGEPCVYCDGKGYVEERQVSYPDLKARVRLDERLLSEPGFEMAFLFLLGQKAARHRAEIERAARLRVRPSLSDARQVNLFARSSRSCA